MSENSDPHGHHLAGEVKSVRSVALGDVKSVYQSTVTGKITFVDKVLNNSPARRQLAGSAVAVSAWQR